MHDYLLSILLGVVEGLTEFLPVSSTAHLRIVEALCHLDLQSSFWKMYTIVIQLGAVLALPVFFRGRIATFFRTFPKGDRGDRTLLTHPVSLTLIAFVITAIPSWAFKKQIGQNLENVSLIAWALLVGGVIMWIVDALCNRPQMQRMEEMTLAQALWIGAAQILSAIFPGTSRSMCTIAAGQLVGLSRAAALEFSFFLSIPTMLAATGYDFFKTVAPHQRTAADAAIAPPAMSEHDWIVLGIGFLVSFVIALLIVAWFMRWVRSRGFVPFAIYRIALGIFLLVLIGRGFFRIE